VASKERSESFETHQRAVAQELLDPVLRFIAQSGITEEDARTAFNRAWRKAQGAPGKRVKLASLADPQPYVDLVTTWARHPDYLDASGRPRDLPNRGKSGFASLVRRTSPALSPIKVAEVLVAYGNVQILPNRRLKLTKPFFHIRTGKRLAFEPSVRFLVDAAANVKSSLNDTSESRDHSNQHQHFWRAVETRSIPERRVKEFLLFVKDQSLSFLQDMDDWLSESGNSVTSKTKTTRMGLGLFTFGKADARE
jgi:hypothetical protein